MTIKEHLGFSAMVFDSEDEADEHYQTMPNKDDYCFVCWDGYSNALMLRSDVKAMNKVLA